MVPPIVNRANSELRRPGNAPRLKSIAKPPSTLSPAWATLLRRVIRQGKHCSAPVAYRFFCRFPGACPTKVETGSLWFRRLRIGSETGGTRRRTRFRLFTLRLHVPHPSIRVNLIGGLRHLH